MATVAVVFDGTRLSGAESESDNGVWDIWDKSQSPTQEGDFVYQGSNSISRKVGTSESGIEFEDDGTVDLTTPQVVLFKYNITTYGILNTIGATGAVLYIGSGTTSDRYNYYVDGSDTYPAAGGWRFLAIDPNVTAYYDATDGTPVLTAADYYALSATMTATSKSENVAMDAIDIFNSGAGLTLTGGDGGDADGTIDDFVSFDEGTSGNRQGIVRTFEGTILVIGTLTIGTSTATVYTDSDREIAFIGGLTDAGFGGLAIGLQSVTSVIGITDYTLVGRGKAGTRRFFDSITQVDPTPDEITVLAHGWTTGDAVLYSDEGGTDTIGLTDATQYFVEVITVDTVAMHLTRQAAITAGTPIALSDGSGGENHSLTRQPDTLPDLVVSGTSGTHTATGCNFRSFRNLTLTSAATHTSCKYKSCKLLTLAQGTLDTCTISSPLTNPGEGFVNTPDLADITDTSFNGTGSTGHGVEITATGTYAFNGNTFTGYWAHSGEAADGARFDTQTGIDPSTEVLTTDAAHGFATGDEVFYEDHGLTDTVGLTDGARYYVNVISTTTLSFHRSKENATADTNRVNLSDGSAGQTHALYSGKAAIVNTSGGLVTINIGGGGSTPTVRNVGAATSVVTNTVTLTVTVVDKDNSPIQFARVSIHTDDVSETELMNEETNASGIATESFAFVSDQSIIVKVRKSSTEPQLKHVTTPGTITSSGFTLTVSAEEDDIILPP